MLPLVSPGRLKATERKRKLISFHPACTLLLCALYPLHVVGPHVLTTCFPVFSVWCSPACSLPRTLCSVCVPAAWAARGTQQEPWKPCLPVRSPVCGGNCSPETVLHPAPLLPGLHPWGQVSVGCWGLAVCPGTHICSPIQFNEYSQRHPLQAWPWVLGTQISEKRVIFLRRSYTGEGLRQEGSHSAESRGLKCEWELFSILKSIVCAQKKILVVYFGFKNYLHNLLKI